MQKLTLTFDNPEIEALLFSLSKENNSSVSYIASNIIENYFSFYAKSKKTANDFIELLETNSISYSDDDLTRASVHNNFKKNDLYR